MCFNHNTETVPRLNERVRRNAKYQRTLDLLKQVKDEAPDMPTKSGLMLGLVRRWTKSWMSPRTCAALASRC